MNHMVWYDLQQEILADSHSKTEQNKIKQKTKQKQTNKQTKQNKTKNVFSLNIKGP